MSALLWLTVAVPALAALLVRLAPRGARALTVVAAATACAPAWLLLAGTADGKRVATSVTWLPAADLDVGLRLDPLSAAMAVTVATVGLIVLVYATGYFAGEPRRRSALAGLLTFLAAMQGLVLADGYLTLLIFWELVGAASSRLIAFNRDDAGAAPGAVRAFVTTRAADVGLYLAVLALFAATGDVSFTDSRPDGGLGAVVALGLIVAAIGKSAQGPLQTWLMGAMAGPTPVSALLHSATMVAAGVYLLIRSHDLLTGWPLVVVGWVGAVTAVASAAIALAQDDLKRVLAGSTSSQLGLMLVGLAAGGPIVALLHLVVHAAGKACLFLSAGIFQHQRGSTALAALRGAGRDDRAAFTCFALGALSIAAVPPMAGFWSKEHIAAAAEHDVGWFALVLVATAGAAAYLLRPALVLWSTGERRAQRAPVSGRRPMLAGAATLAAASVVLGAAGPPLRDLVGGSLPSSPLSLVLSLLALAGGVAAVLAAVRPARAVVRAAARQFYAIELLDALARRPALRLAAAADMIDRRGIDAAVDGVAHRAVRVAAASDALERHGIDAGVDGLARAVGAGGRRLRRLQTGRLYEYLRGTAVGGVAVAALITLAAVL